MPLIIFLDRSIYWIGWSHFITIITAREKKYIEFPVIKNIWHRVTNERLPKTVFTIFLQVSKIVKPVNFNWTVLFFFQNHTRFCKFNFHLKKKKKKFSPIFLFFIEQKQKKIKNVSTEWRYLIRFLNDRIIVVSFCN